MIRVLQFSDIINRYDFIESIVRWSDPRQFEMSVCVRSEKCNIAPPVYRPKTVVHVLDGVGREKSGGAVRTLVSLLRRMKIDIIHAHHFDQGAIAWMATRLHPRTSLVIGRHYSDAIYRVPSRTKQIGLLAIERIVNRGAARIIVPSTFIHRMLTVKQGIEPNKIDIIPYGFEPEKYVLPDAAEVAIAREELHLRTENIAFGTFGRLHEEKGHRYLLEAFATLKRTNSLAKLVIVGDGPEKTAIEKQIGELELGGSVVMLGWRRDVIRLMAAVDVVVQPTLHEAFSQVMAEAMWMRKPLLITDVSGVEDVIRDDVNGIIVARGSSEALTNKMRNLAEGAGFRSRLGEAARTYVESNLIIGKIIPRYEASYQRALQERRGRHVWS
jgi:glycosyltransferase involved in cell wall biosynthesis